MLFLKIPPRVMCAAALAASLVLACGDDAEINKIFCVSANAPEYLSYKVVSGNQIDFRFSTPVSVLSAQFEPDVGGVSWTDGETISLLFQDTHNTGKQIIADMLVADAGGNTLSLLLPFRTRNDRVPALLINEIRTEYYSTPTTKKGEFIEFKTLSAGNLGAVRVYIARAGTEEPVYEFPPVEVEKDAYITLHIRTYPEDAAVDELGGAESFGLTTSKVNAHPASRDLWTHVNAELLRMTDAIYVMDQDDAILDAVMFYKSDDEWQKNKILVKTAELLAKQGAWLGKNGDLTKTPGVSDAVLNAKATATRTLCRDESVPDSHSQKDWYITDTSCASPGAPNNPKRYTPK
jgi:hypothetical protein